MAGPLISSKTKTQIRTWLERSGFTSSSVSSPAKVWVVMIAISLALIFGGNSLGRFGLLVGFLLALSVNSLVFFYADLRIKNLFEGRELEGQDPWGLLSETKNLCRSLGIPRPMLVLVDSSTPFAFSAGLLPTRSTIYFSRALLEKLSAQEMSVVLAYELHRLKTQQTSAATAASALVGLLTHSARAIDSVITLRWFFGLFESVRERRATLLRHGGILRGPMTLLVSPLVALLVRTSVSRRALLTSDRAAGEIAKCGTGTVARTLWKLDSYAKTRPFPVDLAEAHLFTVSPLTRYPMWRFASAQPPIEARLKALTGYEPL